MTKLIWAPDAICLRPPSINLPSLAVDVYERACRTDFDAPGFCLVNLGGAIDSVAFRRTMVDLKKSMAAIHEARTGKTLIFISAARFDQQTTTKPHLDGGPDESMLILGYEPSSVDAELVIFDYAKCAFDMGISPKDFLANHNPMFRAGFDMLRPYSTRLPCFSITDFQLILINNSSAPYFSDGQTWQGTLHTATLITPDDAKRRIVNSIMIASVAISTPDQMSEVEVSEFIHTPVVRRRGYDKTHLDDDA
jgi:hypothetical protein